MDKIWLDTYKASGIVPEVVLPADNTSMIDIFERNFQQYGNRDAFVCMDKRITLPDDEDGLQLGEYWLPCCPNGLGTAQPSFECVAPGE